jgi:hypothetical protein
VRTWKYSPRISTLAAATLGTAACLAAWATASANDGTLPVGWNNISYLGEAQAVSTALAPIEGKYNAAYRWDSQQQVFEFFSPAAPAFANNLDELNAGDSLWLDITKEGAQLTTAGQTGVLSIAASTFLPASDLAIYEKKFNELSPVGTDAASQRYYAPLVLPQGATITSMTAAYQATGGGDVQVRLDYTAIGNADSESGPVYKLAEALSTMGPSPVTASAFAHVVDNSANVYFIVVDLTGGPATKLRGVSVAYTGG